MSKSENKYQKKNVTFVWRNSVAIKFLHTKFKLEFLNSDFDILHLYSNKDVISKSRAKKIGAKKLEFNFLYLPILNYWIVVVGVRYDLYGPFDMGRFRLDWACTKHVVLSPAPFNSLIMIIEWLHIIDCLLEKTWESKS
jgi:hypothetical protein